MFLEFIERLGVLINKDEQFPPPQYLYSEHFRERTIASRVALDG